MYTLDGKTIEEHLLALAEDGNKKFTRSLHPGINNVLGIRVPQLRELARAIAAGDWREYMADAGTHYMEERMLYGMVVGAVKVPDVEEYLALVDEFVPRINSWSVCDTFDFAGRRGFVKKNKDRVWRYLEKWARSTREYEVRFAVVMMLAHFVDEDYVDRVLAWMLRIRHSAYYVKMAVAWNLSVCFVKFPDKTLPLLQSGMLDVDVLGMTVRKILDSRRVAPELKQQCRSCAASVAGK